MIIYSKVRVGISPEMNALASIILGIVGGGVVLSTLLMVRAEKGPRHGRGQSGKGGLRRLSFVMLFSRHSPREASGNPEKFIDKNQCVSWIPRPDICNQLLRNWANLGGE